jgi:GNAT superfamily N-acetyltransferase
VSRQVRVARARLEEVQPLAAAYSRDPSRTRGFESPLPTGALFWRATDEGGTPLGYAAGTLRPEGIMLGPVFVLPEYRREGVARALLAEIERWSESARIPLVEVSVATDNEAGVRFHESVGYRGRRLLMAREPA